MAFAGADVDYDKLVRLGQAALDTANRHEGSCTMTVEFIDGRPPLTMEANAGEELDDVIERAVAKLGITP